MERARDEPSPAGAGSIALVTGASSGIGEQYARQLIERGHRVAVVARREDRLVKLAEQLGGPERAVAIAADLAVPEERDRLAARVDDLGARVEILVNNAGYGIYKPFTAAGRDRELNQVRLLVEAPVDLMARYLPGMVERGRGAVINMSSTAGFQPLPYKAAYAAAKGYLLLLSEAVHAEVQEHGVTVTAVCPGPVPSGFQEASDAGYFANRLPNFTFVSPERVAHDALEAADRGKISVIPGGPQVRAAFGPNRQLPALAGPAGQQAADGQALTAAIVGTCKQPVAFPRKSVGARIAIVPRGRQSRRGRSSLDKAGFAWCQQSVLRRAAPSGNSPQS